MSRNRMLPVLFALTALCIPVATGRFGATAYPGTGRWSGPVTVNASSPGAADWSSTIR